MKKTIEIPFGAKDSELKGWEYTIPENMEAEIKDGKIIVKQKESEDERIRKHIIKILDNLAACHWDGNEKARCIAYLERQKSWRRTDGFIMKTIKIVSTIKIVCFSNKEVDMVYVLIVFVQSPGLFTMSTNCNTP